ncbi:MAG TPA: hypothetical protein VND62_12015 [Acidimicrobiales bacterium]|nr:hypothetical protein [Acidimicrobiales bacterium]
MRVDSFFLANYAEQRGGLANILGAFPEWWTVPNVPCRMAVGFVLVQDLDEAELESAYSIHLYIRPDTTPPPDDSTPLGIVETLPRRTSPIWQGAPTRNLIAHRFPVEFAQHGLHRVTARIWEQGSEAEPTTVGVNLFVKPGPPQVST